MGEAVGEQSRGAGAAARVRPVCGLTAVEHCVVDARVVGDAALGREAQFLEHELGVGVECRGALEPAGEFGEDPELVADALGRGDRAAAADYPTLERRHRALLFRPLGDRQHHVGEGRRLGEEEIADHEQVERRDALAHGVDVR